MSHQGSFSGENHGANAGEYALTALNGCLITALIYHAATQGIKIDEVESSLEGDADLRGFLGIDDSVRNGYERINVTSESNQTPQKRSSEI